MSEKFESGNVFLKDRGNLDMLKRALASAEIDKDIIPILEKFILLPITPIESCYGHADKDINPYFSYVNDDVSNEKDKNFQKLFKEKISELAKSINENIGEKTVDAVLEEIDHGGGPKDFTLSFKINDKINFQKNGKNILDTIWGEFSKYINNLK